MAKTATIENASVRNDEVLVMLSKDGVVVKSQLFAKNERGAVPSIASQMNSLLFKVEVHL